jgi:hypothetical protein
VRLAGERDPGLETTRITVTVYVASVPVAVTVNGYEPGGVLMLVLTVSVEGWPD